MTVKIGLISDIHAAAGPLREALTVFAQERIDLILCAGDVAGYGTELEPSVRFLAESGCITILGNHDCWFMEQQIEGEGTGLAAFFSNLPETWEATMEGKRIFAVHASPPRSMRTGITLLDQDAALLPSARQQWARKLESYDFDVLIVGHTHQVFAEQLGKVLVINPGSTVFNHACAILTLPDLNVRSIPLSDKKIRKVWHWGMMTHQ